MPRRQPDLVAQMRSRLHLVQDADDEDTWHASGAAAAWEAPFGFPEHWDVSVADREMRGPHGVIPIRVYSPNTNRVDRPCLVWFHGGAFVMGDLDMPEAHEVCKGIAGRADAIVVSVDYRLCPFPEAWGGAAPAPGDVRFPVPHDDAHAAVIWTRENSALLGVDSRRIAIGGASAGGNLAAGVGLRLRDEGCPPQQVLLAYAVVHPSLGTGTDGQREDIARIPPMLEITPEANRVIATNYMGGDAAPTPYAFPGISDDLEGFPPTYIEVSQYDWLRISGERFGADLAAAGVDVELKVVSGVPHGHLNRIGLEAARESMDAMAHRLHRSGGIVWG